jgi:hypothetical protein
MSASYISAEHSINIVLCRLVIVLSVIVRRFGHHVRHVAVVQVDEFSEREPELLASQEVKRRVELAI